MNLAARRRAARAAERPAVPDNPYAADYFADVEIDLDPADLAAAVEAHGGILRVVPDAVNDHPAVTAARDRAVGRRREHEAVTGSAAKLVARTCRAAALSLDPPSF